MKIEIDLPAGFLSPEERDGFYVNEKRKKIWAVELDLLHKFSSICEENNLSYFMDGGTLLGAIRHKGFIPWDDDVDVNMPRKDYDKFVEIAPHVLKEPYFCQTSLTADGFFREHAQLRNSSTTGFIKNDAYKKDVNKGIWLDVFPLDNVPDSLIQKKWQRKEIAKTKALLKMKYDRTPTKTAQAYYRNHSFRDTFIYFDSKVLAAFSNKETKLIGNLTLAWKENWIWPKAFFQDYCYLPFENISLRAPLFYREVMQRQYGVDYMSLPAGYKNYAVEPGIPGNGSTHGGTIFDPDTPYSEFNIEAALKNN